METKMYTDSQEKYKKHYDNLINRAKNRILNEYSEKHHILPRCLGGSDNQDNLVQLTAEEHFVAHQLLIKIYPNEPKLAYAALIMTTDKNGNRVNNKLFGWLRRELAKAISITNTANAKERTRKSGETQRGKKLSSEHKEKLSLAGQGRSHSEETKQKMSISAKNRSEETKQKRNKMHSSTEYREKLRAASSKKKWIFNQSTKETKFVDLEIIDKYLSDGWKLGRS
jgi:hypothetical protein